MTMQDDLRELAQIKGLLTALNSQKNEVEQRLTASMSAKGQKTVSVTDDNGNTIKGTLVAATTITIDNDKLKKSLGPKLWDKVTVKVLDKEKLEAHIVTGDVDANVVAAASEEKPKKPYIKVSGDLPVGPEAGVVSTKNSAGKTKPAAKKRVVRPAKGKVG